MERTSCEYKNKWQCAPVNSHTTDLQKWELKSKFCPHSNFIQLYAYNGRLVYCKLVVSLFVFFPPPKLDQTLAKLKFLFALFDLSWECEPRYEHTHPHDKIESVLNWCNQHRLFIVSRIHLINDNNNWIFIVIGLAARLSPCVSKKDILTQKLKTSTVVVMLYIIEQFPLE